MREKGEEKEEGRGRANRRLFKCSQDLERQKDKAAGWINSQPQIEDRPSAPKDRKKKQVGQTQPHTLKKKAERKKVWTNSQPQIEGPLRESDGARSAFCQTISHLQCLARSREGDHDRKKIARARRRGRQNTERNESEE